MSIENLTELEEGELLELPPRPAVHIKTDSKYDSEYKSLEELGKGKFGTVHKCKRKTDGLELAAKFLRKTSSSKKEVLREIEMMNLLHHKRLISLFDAFETSNQMVVIMELVTGGELFEKIVEEDNLSEKQVIRYMRQVLYGVQHMHRKNMVHLDLKPENILCLGGGTPGYEEIKLIDFGMTRVLSKDKDETAMCGTPEFVAPEVITFNPITLASDMWSIGVITYVLLSGLSPFMGDDDNETLKNVTLGEYDFEDDDGIFEAISDDATGFIEDLLILKPAERLTVDECLQHSWLQGSGSEKKLATKNLKKFIARRRWQRTMNTIKAVSRLAGGLSLFGERAGAHGSNTKGKFLEKVKRQHAEEEAADAALKVKAEREAERKQLAEKRKKEEEDKKKKEAEELERKKQEEIKKKEAEQNRLAEEKKRKEEEEKKRIEELKQKEAEKKRLEEAKKKQETEESRKKKEAEEAEKKRDEDRKRKEAEQKKIEEARKKREVEEAEKKREEERKRKEAEQKRAEEARKKREVEEAEKKRDEDRKRKEAEQKKIEEARKKKEVEEAEKKREAEEAERKLKGERRKDDEEKKKEGLLKRTRSVDQKDRKLKQENEERKKEEKRKKEEEKKKKLEEEKEKKRLEEKRRKEEKEKKKQQELEDKKLKEEEKKSKKGEKLTRRFSLSRKKSTGENVSPEAVEIERKKKRDEERERRRQQRKNKLDSGTVNTTSIDKINAEPVNKENTPNGTILTQASNPTKSDSPLSKENTPSKSRNIGNNADLNQNSIIKKKLLIKENGYSSSGNESGTNSPNSLRRKASRPAEGAVANRIAGFQSGDMFWKNKK